MPPRTDRNPSPVHWGFFEALLDRLGHRGHRTANITPQASHSAEEGTLADLLRLMPWLSLADFRGKCVIDFGSGAGRLVCELAPHAARAIGLECRDELIEASRQRAAALGLSNARFINSRSPEAEPLAADWIISQNSLEHIDDPAAMLAECARRLAPGGRVAITFGPPWFHPLGHHMPFITPLPWFHLLFPERAVLNVRARYRDDGARHYEEISGGLNKMSYRKFRRLVRESGLAIERVKLWPIHGLAPLTCLPALRELFIAVVSATLRKI